MTAHATNKRQNMAGLRNRLGSASRKTGRQIKHGGTHRAEVPSRPASAAGTAPPRRLVQIGPFFRVWSVLVLLLLLLSAGVARAAEDWFDTLDLNHDGLLDKSEYEQGLEKLQAFLRQPLAKAAVGGGTSSIVESFQSVVQDRNLLSLAGFWKAFTSGVAMILATEIGDKTFFIAAVLSMKHDRMAVFVGAMSALIFMTILSTAMGLILPTVGMPRRYTHVLSGLLFLYFGCKLIYDSRQMEAGRTSEELEEVEEELLQQSNKKEDVEAAKPKAPSSAPTSNSAGAGAGAASSGGAYQVALQAFSLTFMAEWGDRSQIATIALAAAKNPLGVTVGGCLGHFCCTGLAVLGGRMLAARISEKTVNQWGGALFFVFGLHSLFLES